MIQKWMFPKNSGTPKWMVYFMENPMNKWMIWGVKPPIFGSTPLNGVLEESVPTLEIFCNFLYGGPSLDSAQLEDEVGKSWKEFLSRKSYGC